MKTKVFDSKYVICYQWDSLNIFEITWLPESEFGEEREFFQLTEQLLQGRKFQFVIADTRLFRFPISPELQIEYGAYSSNRFIEAGCNKLAVILPYEPIANLGVQQLVEEVDEMDFDGIFKTRYFLSLDGAEEWIKNDL